jgi:hypothetical protein
MKSLDSRFRGNDEQKPHTDQSASRNRPAQQTLRHD